MNEEPHRSEKYKQMSLEQIVTTMSEMHAAIDELNKRKSDIQAEYDAIRKHALPDAMDDAGLSNMTVKGVGRISLRHDVYATIKAGNKVAAFDWLRGTGHGGIVQESVHAATLKALMKTLIKEGGDLPPEELINVTPYSLAVLTRTK